MYLRGKGSYPAVLGRILKRTRHLGSQILKKLLKNVQKSEKNEKFFEKTLEIELKCTILVMWGWEATTGTKRIENGNEKIQITKNRRTSFERIT